MNKSKTKKVKIESCEECRGNGEFYDDFADECEECRYCQGKGYFEVTYKLGWYVSKKIPYTKVKK
jgi:DnaJ-class molecular chaperone